MINKLKKNAKVWIIILGALAGVVLLLIGSGDKDEPVKIDADAMALSEYAEQMEKKIYELCSNVKGVSDVSVAVSFESGFEYVYAKNDEKGDLITVGSGSSKTAVKVTEKPPTIGGIGIVCRGGGDPIIQNRLISLLSATFGVSSTKIYITEAEK